MDDPDRIGHVTWRQAFVVTPTYRRFRADGLLNEGPPDLVWFHNSGRLILGRYALSQNVTTEKRRIQLQTINIVFSE